MFYRNSHYLARAYEICQYYGIYSIETENMVLNIYRRLLDAAVNKKCQIYSLDCFITLHNNIFLGYKLYFYFPIFNIFLSNYIYYYLLLQSAHNSKWFAHLIFDIFTQL